MGTIPCPNQSKLPRVLCKGGGLRTYAVEQTLGTITFTTHPQDLARCTAMPRVTILQNQHLCPEPTVYVCMYLLCEFSRQSNPPCVSRPAYRSLSMKVTPTLHSVFPIPKTTNHFFERSLRTTVRLQAKKIIRVFPNRPYAGNHALHRYTTYLFSEIRTIQQMFSGRCNAPHTICTHLPTPVCFQCCGISHGSPRQL